LLKAKEKPFLGSACGQSSIEKIKAEAEVQRSQADGPVDGLSVT
jgi:hypothetical protein